MQNIYIYVLAISKTDLKDSYTESTADIDNIVSTEFWWDREQ